MQTADQLGYCERGSNQGDKGAPTVREANCASPHSSMPPSRKTW